MTEIVLPEEMIKEIGTYLPAEDILNCNLVNRLWRNSMNNNKIWSRLCLENFDVEMTPCPLIKWPCEVEPPFSPPPNSCEKLSPPCSWWIRYMQETRIASNFNRNRRREHSLVPSFEVLEILSDFLVGFVHSKLGFEFYSLFPFRVTDFINADVPLNNIPYFYVNDQEFLFIRPRQDEMIAYFYKKESLKYELKTTINLSEDLKRSISIGPLSRKIYHCESGFLVFVCTIFDLQHCLYTCIDIWNLKDFTKKTTQFLPEPHIKSMKIIDSKLFFHYYADDYFYLNILEFDTMKIKSMQISCGPPSSHLFLNDEIIFGCRNQEGFDFIFCNIYNGKTFSIPVEEKVEDIKALNSKYIVVHFEQSLRLLNCAKRIFERKIALDPPTCLHYLLNIPRLNEISLLDLSRGRDINNQKTRSFTKSVIMEAWNLVKGSSNAVACNERSLFQYW